MFQIDDIVNDLKGNGEVILCGDFNSRIGDQPCMLKNESNKFLSLPDDHVSDIFKPRNSQDRVKTRTVIFLEKLQVYNQKDAV